MTIIEFAYRWVSLMTSMLEFSLRLCGVADKLYEIVDSLETEEKDMSESFTVEEAGQGVACRITEVIEEGDDIFDVDLNFLMLNDTEVVEIVQVWVTSVIDTQIPSIMKYSSNLLDMVQEIFTKQLELGESELKAVTMRALGKLHMVWGSGTLEMWGEESMWLAGIVNLLVSSDELNTEERDELRQGLISVLTSVHDNIEDEHQLTILFSHITPVWKELLLTGKVDKLGTDLEKVIKNVVIKGLSQNKLVENEDNMNLYKTLLEMPNPDLEVLTKIAWSEVLESDLMIGAERGGKRRLEGDLNKRSMQFVSPAWRLVLGYFDGKLDSFDNLVKLCDVLGTILTEIVKHQCSRCELEILDTYTITQATETVVNLLCNKEGKVAIVLECLEILIQVGHMWPGAAQFGSEIGAVQHIWAGVLSLPWLGRQAQGKMGDLRLGEKTQQLVKASKEVKWYKVNEDKAIMVLASLPKDVCPKWRLSVAKLAWVDKREGLVMSLPHLVATMGPGAAILGGEVVQCVAGKESDVSLVRCLAKICAKYICSLAKTVTSKVVMNEKEGTGLCRTKLEPACSLCDGWTGRMRTPAKGGTVLCKEVEPFLKMIGHQDPEVRYSIISLLESWSKHSTMSPDAASLWLTCVSDKEEKVRMSFSTSVSHIFNCKTDTLGGQDSVFIKVVNGLADLSSTISSTHMDTYISTLVTATNSQKEQKCFHRLLDILLELYFSPTSTITTYVRALPTLQAAMATHKNHLVVWCAKAMCQNKYNPKQVINYLTLLCPTDIEPKEFINNNLHHLLPPVILYSANTNNSTALEMISSYMGQKSRTLLMFHFPSLFTHLIINAEDQQHMQKCLEYLHNHTSKDLAVMLPTNRLRVLVELLTKFNFSKNRITQALSMCARADDMFKHPEKKKSDKKGLTTTAVAQYISQGLMAVLSSFTNSLSNKETPEESKLQILNSLNDLIIFLGHDNMVSCKYSILECIKKATSLSKESTKFASISINLWDSFIHSMALSSLVEMLPQILCGLLPLLNSCPEKIRELFKFLLEKNLDQFKAQVPCLIFLPSEPQLEDIVGKLRGQELDFKDVIRRLLHCLNHECVDVRLQTLKTLSGLMDMYMGALQALIICSDRTDPMVTSLVQKLMAGLSLREPDKDVRALSAVCLGKIGAIDPGKMEFVMDLGSSDEDLSYRNKVLDMFSVGFCVQLLHELVRAQASSREILVAENCAFSIQEVLKVYGIQLSDKSPDSFTWRVWRTLPDSTQEILTPLLSSMYKHESSSKPSLQTPIYESQYGRTYKDWLVNWSQHLLTMLYDEKTKALFDACLPALKKDVRIAELLLPRLVVEVLSWGGEKELEEIMVEVRTLIDSQTDVTKAGTPQSEIEDKPLENNLQQIVAQALFSILDHIGTWMRTKFAYLMSTTRKPESQLKPEDIQTALKKSKEYIRVKSFKDQIPHEGLANLSYQTGAYHRSAFHLDQYLKHTDIRSTGSSWLSSLQKLYVALEEPDLVMGAAIVREEEAKLEELIMQHEATGNYQDALCCYERQGGVDNLGHINCYLSIDQPATAASLAAGLVAKQADLMVELAPTQVEAAWQLGKWDDLSKYSNIEGDEGEEMGWQLGLGKIMLEVKREQWGNTKQLLAKLRGELVEPLSAGSLEQGAYSRGYTNINKLSMLCEVEKLADKFIFTSERELAASTVGSTELLKEMSCRLSYTQKSWTSLEPMIRLRRGVLGLAVDRIKHINVPLADRLQFEIGECWLRSTQLARESGQLQEAYGFLLEVKKSKHIEFFLETAKLSWARGDHTEAISALKRGIADTFPRIVAALAEPPDAAKSRPGLNTALEALSSEEKDVLCQGKLLLAKYMEEAANESNNVISDIYNEVKLLAKNEDVYFCSARSMDKQLQGMKDEQLLSHADPVFHTCAYYLSSMTLGPTHLHHSLPRMLSLWLDFADVVMEFTNKKGKDQIMIATVNMATKYLEKITTSVKSWRKRTPQYYCLTALPQIVSRICHTHTGSYNVLGNILSGLLVGRYYQQTFWHMVSVSKNRDNTRKTRCNDIFKDAITANPEREKFLRDATALAKKIDELCDAKTEKGVKSVSLRDVLRSLPSLVNQPDFSPVILPNQRNMIVTLPTVDANVQNVQRTVEKHEPFPSGLVTIEAIEDQVAVMPSLVQPKKIIFRGNDGKMYPFLAKPKDDLRRDCRLMDFTSLLNKLFKKDREARKRDLCIRTYTVVPTNETSGLIEWVDNLKGLRPIILQLHKENGMYLSSKWTMSYNSHKNDPIEKKRKNLTRCLEDQKGAVFSEWFAKTFPDPQAWLMARMAYTRTTAVMSMMGYIIGLGDRHLENINVDTKTGQTFHVDMNCLFNKGETMEVPEVVPFRLTHNMVDAFGPLGIEGPFRISCEVALSVMRKERDVLMSVLRPFVFDPLVDWAKSSKSGGASEGLEALRRVQERLTGNVSSTKKDQRKKTLINHPLSVEGQVNYVIEQATDHDNLAVMYWGWAPYL